MATQRITGSVLQPFTTANLAAVSALLVQLDGNFDVLDSVVLVDVPILYTDGYIFDAVEGWSTASSSVACVDLEYTEASGVVYLGVLLGQHYDAIAETLDLELSQGSTNKQQNVARVTLKVEDTAGLEVGSDENFLSPIRDNDTEIRTDEEELHITGQWDEGAAVVMKSSPMLPVTVLCLTANVGVSRS